MYSLDSLLTIAKDGQENAGCRSHYMRPTQVDLGSLVQPSKLWESHCRLKRIAASTM